MATIARLELLHNECRRWSKDDFLVVPGEEPNVHFGGHWISLFPRPVYWILNRSDEQPFVEQLGDGTNLYRVGSSADVLDLLIREGGWAWTSHPRIKSSVAEPDSYKDEPFFGSDRFVGAAWKAMPADNSLDRLGTRVLDLYDDMLDWGVRKHVLGEEDIFRVEARYELYGHMNINYLRLDHIPSFDSGWSEIGEVLASGSFFVTTGEVLIASLSGTLAAGRKKLVVRATLNWTFPLAFAEVITGGRGTRSRTRLDLSNTQFYGSDEFEISVSTDDIEWWRFEVWDIATNGAFSQAEFIDGRPPSTRQSGPRVADETVRDRHSMMGESLDRSAARRDLLESIHKLVRTSVCWPACRSAGLRHPLDMGSPLSARRSRHWADP